MSVEAARIMVQDKAGSRSAKRASKPLVTSRKGDAAFDLWLDRGLHKLFDDVANEPVPEELLRLIEEGRRK